MSFRGPGVRFFYDGGIQNSIKLYDSNNAPGPSIGLVEVWADLDQGKLYATWPNGTVDELSGSSTGGGGSGASVSVVNNISGRDSLTGMTNGSLAYVTDASGDSTVNSGSALYIYVQATADWEKINQNESIDLDLSQFLNLGSHTTDDITEGSSNLFLTEYERYQITQIGNSSGGGAGALSGINVYEELELSDNLNIDWSSLDMSSYSELRIMVDFIYSGSSNSSLDLRGIINGLVDSSSIYDYNVYNAYTSTNTTSDNSSSQSYGRIIDDSNGMADSNNKYQLILNITGFGLDQYTKIHAQSVYQGPSNWARSESHVVIKSESTLDGLSIYASGGQIKGQAHLYGIGAGSIQNISKVAKQARRAQSANQAQKAFKIIK